MIKDIVGRIVQSNAFVSDGFYAALTKNETKEFYSLVNTMCSIDTIACIDDLISFRSEINRGARWFTRYENVTNCYCYGIWKAIFPFLDEKDAVWYPSVEHGFIGYDCVTNETFKAARLGCVTFSDFRRKIIQKKLPIPVYTVGPYIQYAKHYYSKERIHNLRKKLGKTLLFFVGHSVDTAKITRDEMKLLDWLSKKTDEYETLLICTFWWDCASPFIKKCRSLGYTVVSAGYLNDPNFLPRLKTIIALSDVVYTDSFGTHVLYSVSEGVVVRFVDVGSQIINSDTMLNKSHFFNEIEDLFFHDWSNQTEERIRLLRYYCGIGVSRTLDERRAIADATKELTERAKGWRNRAPSAAIALSGEYSNANQNKLVALAEGYSVCLP